MNCAHISRSSGPASNPRRGHCVVLGQDTLFSQCLSQTQEYKWVPANLMLGVTLHLIQEE